MAIFRCPKCEAVDATVVKDSRAWANGRAIRRRRVCTTCNHRFTTHEVLITVENKGVLRLGSIIRKMREHIDTLEGLIGDMDMDDIGQFEERTPVRPHQKTDA